MLLSVFLTHQGLEAFPILSMSALNEFLCADADSNVSLIFIRAPYKEGFGARSFFLVRS